MNVQIATDGDITDFEGDVIIVPCDSELTFTKSHTPNPNYPLFTHESKKSLIKNIFDKAGKELVRELSVIGYIEVGSAVIVQGYKLRARNIIFMPITDLTNNTAQINHISLHKSLRAAFTLVNLYKAKSVAIASIYLPNKKNSYFKSLWNKFLGDSNETKHLSSSEIEDIIISIFKDLVGSPSNELVIYK